MNLDGINCDLHAHSNITDGKNSVYEMVAAANQKGMEIFAITEHVRKDSSWIREYVEAVEKAKNYGGCKVILGFETKLLDMDGTLDIPKHAQERAELLICSLHRIPGIHDMGGDLAISDLDKNKTKGIYIEALKAICKNPSVDVIGHPFDLLQRHNIPMPNEDEMHGIAKVISAYGKAVEINTNYNMPPVEFIRICRDYGIKFSIGSDAHDVSRVGDISGALEMLAQAGGSKNDLMEMCFL